MLTFCQVTWNLLHISRTVDQEGSIPGDEPDLGVVEAVGLAGGPVGPLRVSAWAVSIARGERVTLFLARSPWAARAPWHHQLRQGRVLAGEGGVGRHAGAPLQEEARPAGLTADRAVPARTELKQAWAGK